MEHGIKLDDYDKKTTVHAKAVDEDDNGFANQPAYGEKYDPSHDKRDMYRLGRKQELKRRFKYCAYKLNICSKY